MMNRLTRLRSRPFAPLRETALLVLFGAAAVGAHAEQIKRMEPLLGTYVEIVAEGEGVDLQAAVDQGFDAFRKVDRLLSSYKPESELNAINRLAGVRPVGISPWTYECLAQAAAVGRESRGAFDITCRPLLEIWGFLTKKYRVPSDAEIQKAKSLVNYRRLELQAAPLRKTAYLSGDGMTIDVGGIGKGFAVDKAVEALKEAGVGAGRVRAWGDCSAFGERDWTIEIEKGKTVRLRNEAISTSGDYENFFESGGRHNAHIVDPRTGRPVPGVRSVTIKARTCTQSDAWSTALFVDPALRPDGIGIVFFEPK
jgi:FAD:protein FMN transferase